MNWFLKNQLSNKNQVFFIVNVPMRRKLPPFMTFRLLESHHCYICSRKCNFELKFFIEKILT